MIAVVDYHKGNLKSVERGLIDVGADARITDDPSSIARAEAVVLPGVGAFYDAALTMNELGQMDVVRAQIEAGIPFLGICLGLQLMFQVGEEVVLASGEDAASYRPQGLGILPGMISKIPKKDEKGRSYKVPHVGWNDVWPCSLSELEEDFVVAVSSDAYPAGATSNSSATSCETLPAESAFSCPLLEGVPAGEYFYFTHSYCAPVGSYTQAVTTHSTTFSSVVQYGAASFGVQFHPEKSSDAGLLVLRNFVDIVRRG